MAPRFHHDSDGERSTRVKV